MVNLGIGFGFPLIINSFRCDDDFLGFCPYYGSFNLIVLRF